MKKRNWIYQAILVCAIFMIGCIRRPEAGAVHNNEIEQSTEQPTEQSTAPTAKMQETIVIDGRKIFDVRKRIQTLRSLGLDGFSTEWEDQVVAAMLSYPRDFAEALSEEQACGLILSMLGKQNMDMETLVWQPGDSQIYTFDLEVYNINHMYTQFLNGVAAIAGSDLKIDNIVEDTSQVDYESGTGIQTIQFHCNDSFYQYDAESHHDWFDTNMIVFMNQVIKEQQTGRQLWVTGDGYQDLVIFYQSAEWAKAYEKAMGYALWNPESD